MKSLQKRPLVALLAPMEGPKPLLAPMEGPKQCKYLSNIHKRGASLQSKPLPYSDLCEIAFQSIFANGDGQWTNTEIGESVSVSATSASEALASRASAYGASTSGAPDIRERAEAFNMDDDPLVVVAVGVDDDDDDDDDGNSRLIMDYNQQLALIIIMFNYLRYVQSMKEERKRDNNSAMSGHQFTLELLQGNKRQCVELLCVAHDSRILSKATRNKNTPFPLPPSDKYYLCDAAYAHTGGFMAPYRNVRYWLGDFR
nr:hypothetical protein [Tanacetum cinerariifolium]